VLADAQLFGDFFVRRTVDDKPQDVLLPAREVRGFFQQASGGRGHITATRAHDPNRRQQFVPFDLSAQTRQLGPTPRRSHAGPVQDCEDDTAPLQVTITAKNGEKGTDAAPRVEDDGIYKITFKKIPAGAGTKATAVVECEVDTYSTNLTIKRPPGTKLTQIFNIAP